MKHFVDDEKPESQMPKPITKPSISNGAKKTFKNANVTDANNIVALSGHFSGDLEELEERVRSMMEKSQNNYANGLQKADICKVCGKEGKGNVIKDHIEANHLEGIVIPCNICDKTFKSRNSLRHHKTRHQSNLI